jgi:hypothetical protein
VLTALQNYRKKVSSLAIATAFMAIQIGFPLLAPQMAAAAGNPAADLDQCRNGQFSAPVVCTGAAWANGNAGASNSHYREGDSIAYRMRFDNLSLGAHSVTIQWDTTKGGTHALDYLTTYNRTEPAADPCSGVAGCGSATTFAIPDDPNSTVAQVPGVFTLFNGTITSLSAYTLSGSYASDSSTSITINFTAANATPVLAWGGHIASQIDWGFGNSASAVSGSPYHTRLLNLDGSGGNQDRSLAAAAVVPTPTITTQVSTAALNIGQTVTDTASLSGPNSPLKGTVSFFVCGPSVSNPTCTTGGTQVGGAVSVSPGTGTAGTAVSAAYAPQTVGNYCLRAEYTPAADSPYSPQNHTNLTTECFAVSQAPSSITIIKDAKPNSAQDFNFSTTGGLSASSFSLDDDSDNTLSNTQTFNSVSPGVYTITEAATSGWDFSTIDCGAANNVSISGSMVTITITGGQSVSCTYTNLKRGTITVHKVTNPSNDSTAFSVTASGTGSIGGNATRNISTSQDAVYDVAQGTYSVNETVPAGWTQVGNTCSNLVISDTNLTRECTITNTKLAKLKIVKTAVPNSAQDFIFSTTGSGLTGFMLDDDNDSTLPNQQQFIDLLPGDFTVSEQATSGWDLTGLTCSGTQNFSRPNNGNALNVTLAAGDDVTCTFTNTQRGSISGLKFNDLNGNGIFDQGEPTLSGWTIYDDANHNGVLDMFEASAVTDISGSFTLSNLVSGTYHLMEVLVSGWTQTAAPSDVQLAAGQNSTGNNFGNFQNGSISGLKFNDLNGNGSKDGNEPNIAGWTINIFNDDNDPDALLNNLVATTQTDQSGNYSFTNLLAGTYQVCEAQQTGWTQTFPVNNGCYMITIDQSGEANTNTNFGNQGRGTITVIKNVDTDDDGTVDQQDVSNWTWDIDGTGNHVTGSTNSQAVAAGSYSVSEDQKTDYHVVASSCSGETPGASPSESLRVTVDAGEDVVCTFTNARDRGTLRLIKEVINDNGGPATAADFTLHVTQDGVDVSGSPAVGSDTGTVYDLLTGSYEVSESNQAIGYTQTGIVCDDEETSTANVTLNNEVVCIITNDDNPPVINIDKTNDQPTPTVVGDTVVYTLIVTVPEDSGVVYDAQVTDLPPKNFQYVTGSWTAQSSIRGDLKAADITPEPPYGSPGGWLLGTLLPGEKITLTYVAKILNNVTPGTYPDVAFVRGLSAPAGQVVLGNVTRATTPFVSTAVTIIKPTAIPNFQASESNILVNTGSGWSKGQIIIPLILISLTIYAYRLSRREAPKGAKL